MPVASVGLDSIGAVRDTIYVATTQKGSSGPTDALLGFFLGLLAAGVGGVVRRWMQRRELIMLFDRELRRIAERADQATTAKAHDSYFSIRFNILDTIGTTFVNDVEYGFPVFTEELFRSEGARLLPLLSGKARTAFWGVYSRARDIETTRNILRDDKASVDRDAYRQLFRELANKLRGETTDLVAILEQEKWRL